MKREIEATNTKKMEEKNKKMDPYEKLAQKYELPSFHELDKEFDFTNFEETPFILRAIRKRMIEKINYLREFIEEMLQPEATLPALVECKSFTDEQKEKMFGTYRRMMQIVRQGIECAALEDEAKDAEFIKQTNQNWQTLKVDVAEFAGLAITCWKKEQAEERENYLG